MSIRKRRRMSRRKWEWKQARLRETNKTTKAYKWREKAGIENRREEVGTWYSVWDAKSPGREKKGIEKRQKKR